MAAFSLIVTQYQSLSTFAAVVARLSSLIEAIEQAQTPKQSAIEIVEAEGRVAYEGLTLLPPAKAEPLLKDLSISMPAGTRILITGSNQAAGAALFRATAGVSTAGSGRIMRPRASEIRYLTQRPYLPPGTLREIFESGAAADNRSDEPIFALLRELNLERVVTQAGGLDSERDWLTLLSLREQQLVAMQVLLSAPQFVLLDRIGGTLESGELDKILQRLAERSIAYVNNETAAESRHLYDAVLECGTDGRWKWTALN